MKREYETGDLEILIDGVALDKNEYELKDLKIKMKENNHTNLELVLEIKNELSKKYNVNKFIKLETKKGSGRTVYNYQKIEIELGKTTYFTGYITYINKTVENSDGIIITIKSKTKTVQLDRVKRYRAYQNSETTYNELVEETMKRYEHDVNFLSNEKLSTEIGEVIIQYDETDWEFLNRLLSRVGLGIYCGGHGELVLGHKRDEGRKRVCHENCDEGAIVDEKGNTAIELWTYGSYITGENLHIDGEDKGYISEGEIEYIGGRFKGRYVLRRAEFVYPYIPNRAIKGNSVECQVVSVPKEGKSGIAVMTVNFGNGLTKIAEKRNRPDNETESHPDFLGSKPRHFVFPYTTPYSQTNTGYFCTPEIDDTVSMYFPIDEEGNGCVQWSINSDGNGRFSNPEKRNYTLKSGGDESDKEDFHFTLDLNKYNVYAANSIEQTAESRVLLTSNDTFGINSVNELILYVEKSMKVSGEEQLSNFSKVQENVTEKKIEIIDVLEGIYSTEMTIKTLNKNLIVSENYLVQAGGIAENITEE